MHVEPDITGAVLGRAACLRLPRVLACPGAACVREGARFRVAGLRVERVAVVLEDGFVGTDHGFGIEQKLTMAPKFHA